MVREVHVPGMLAASNGVFLIALWEPSLRMKKGKRKIKPIKSSGGRENPQKANLSNHWFGGYPPNISWQINNYPGGDSEI